MRVPEYQPIPKTDGPVAWMASNPVAANLLMGILVVGGLILAGTVKQEVFPEVDLDVVTVSVPYPGASPEEVEEGIVLAVEEEVRAVDGVKKVTSVSYEGAGLVSAELLLSADGDRALNDIKSAVDRITSFPRDAERPIVSLATNRQQVMNIVIHGPLTRHALYDLSEDIRSELIEDPRVTLVETGGLPPPEISIEISQEQLRRYGLTLEQLSQVVASGSLDLPGGSVKTASGEVLLRTSERRDVGSEFEEIIVVSDASGTRVRLGEIATVLDSFQDNDAEAFYNGEAAAIVKVYRTGEESPLDVAEAVNAYLAEKAERLPPGVSLTVTDDSSQIFRDRISLLLRNGALGAFLVLIVLGIFLQPRLAFWVTLGMPISFLGVFIFISGGEVSINMISLFAFILTLGIVVDDAVVVGEAVFTHREKGENILGAAIAGAREVLAPVIFAVLTTIIAFSPLLFVPGVMGKFFKQIPLIVIPVLFISLIESLLILPAHLAHVRRTADTEHWGWTGWIFSKQKQFSNWLEHIIRDRYVPFAHKVVRARYLTLALCAAVLIVCIGFVAGGRLAFNFMPSVESDQVNASLLLSFGAPADETLKAMQHLIASARQTGAGVDDDFGDTGNGGLIKGIYSEIGRSSPDAGGFNFVAGDSGAHMALVSVYLAPAGERRISAEEFARRWRAAVGEVPGIDRLSFAYSTGPQAGKPVSIQLSHGDPRVLETAAQRLAGELRSYDGVSDIDDGFQEGKRQLDLELKPAARGLGISEKELATQVRGAFYGVEAKRQQRGRDELKIYVRFPKEERRSVYDIESFILSTPGGGEIPLHQAATVREGVSFTKIERRDGRRVVEVSAEVDKSLTTGGRITASVVSDVLPDLLADYPGLSYALSGEQEAEAEALSALARGMLIALIAMYAMMAIAFHSYVHPILILVAIPFGLIGAILGHMLMGYDLSLISMLGLVALSGVVINDSLVLVYAIDARRDEGVPVIEAVVSGAARRVRPVLLTSLTTFFGLAPMIFETSLQARFLIPMAISLGFGVLLVTGIALVLVPSLYVVIEDIRARLLGARIEESPEAGVVRS